MESSLAKIRARRKRREDFIATHGGEKQGPWIYLIVATGNIYEDVVQATAPPARAPTLSPSSVPPASPCWTMCLTAPPPRASAAPTPLRRNFRLMREAMDKVGEELGRYIRVCNYCSGLCMPGDRRHGRF